MLTTQPDPSASIAGRNVWQVRHVVLEEDAGDVDQQPGRAELLLDGVAERQHRVLVAHVAGKPLVVEIRPGNREPVGVETRCDGRPDRAGGAGDHGDPPVRGHQPDSAIVRVSETMVTNRRYSASGSSDTTRTARVSVRSTPSTHVAISAMSDVSSVMSSVAGLSIAGGENEPRRPRAVLAPLRIRSQASSGCRL